MAGSLAGLLFLAACGVTPRPLTPVEDPPWERCTPAAAQADHGRAREEMRRGRPAEALAAARSCLALCPEFVPGHILYQDAALALPVTPGQPQQQGTREMRSFYAEYPDDGRSPLPPYFKARLARAARREADCQQLLAESLRRNPRFYFAYLERAEMWRGVGKPAPALEALTKALGLRPKFATAWLCQAEIQASLSQVPEAIRSYREYRKLRPTDNRATYALAKILVYDPEGDLREAASLIEYLRRIQPEDLDLQMHEAALSWRQGKLGVAQAAYRKVLIRDPRRSRAALNLANLYYEQGAAARGDARVEAWRRARRAYHYYRGLDEVEDAFDWWDMNLGAPRRLKEIETLLGPRRSKAMPRVSDL